VVARKYGVSPKSHLLQNDGTGRFTDVTLEKAPALAEVGMVTSAAWIDSDVKGKLDLVLVGEWMPLKVFRQENGRFVDRTAKAGLAATAGWWNTVAAVDLRGNGRKDLVVGNLGLNSYLRANADEPARLFIGDFAHSGSLAQVLTFFRNGVSYPLAGRDELVRAIPSLGNKYTSYQSFGASTIEDILPGNDLDKATVLEAKTFASAVALNNGDGTFALHSLPMEAQLAPVYAALTGDFDGDGRIDLVVGGNFLGVTPVQGRYDASYGLLMRGDGAGAFQSVDMGASGLALEGQVRHIKPLRGANGDLLIVVARNDNTVQVVRANGVRRAAQPGGPASVPVR
jgi:hypothetical protein